MKRGRFGDKKSLGKGHDVRTNGTPPGGVDRGVGSEYQPQLDQLWGDKDVIQYIPYVHTSAFVKAKIHKRRSSSFLEKRTKPPTEQGHVSKARTSTDDHLLIARGAGKLPESGCARVLWFV